MHRETGIFVVDCSQKQAINKQQFESLKEKVLSNYAGYMDVVRNTSFDDLTNIKAQLQSMESYMKLVECNSNYRDFINQY